MAACSITLRKTQSLTIGFFHIYIYIDVYIYTYIHIHKNYKYMQYIETYVCIHIYI